MPKDKRISARLKKRNSGRDYRDVSVYEIGPLGVSVAESSDDALRVSTPVDIEISVDGETSEFAGLVISKHDEQDGVSVVYIRFLSAEREFETSDRRSEERWLCPPTFLPMAVSPAPGKFNEFIKFQIRDISKTGLKLQTDLTNSFLMRGMILRLTISLPLIGDTSLLCKILRIEIAENAGVEVMNIGAEVIDTDTLARELLDQYVLQFAATGSLDRVKDYGFQRISASSAVSFEFIRSESDLVSYLDLRNKHPGLLTRLLDAAFTLYDRIAVTKLNGEIVAGVRVSFPENTSVNLVSRDEVSSNLPRRDQVIELSDLVTDQASLTYSLGLLGFVCSTCLSGHRPFALCYFDREYWALLKKAGFTAAPGFTDDHTLFLGHPIESVTGTGANPIYWNLAWNDASKYLEESKTTVPKGTSRIMLKIYRTFSWLSRIYFQSNN